MRKVFGVSLFSSTLILAGCDLLGDGKELTELSEAADKEAPSIVSRNPDVDATGVSVSTPLVIGFSEALDPDTVNSDNVKVKQGDTEITSIAISYNSSSRQIILTPDDDSLARNTQYRIELSADVRDVNGNPLRFTRDTFDNDGNIISELTDWGFVTETSTTQASSLLPTPVHGARLALLDDDRVLIVGGRNTGQGSADDFFNPTTAYLFSPGDDSVTDVSDDAWTESRQRGLTVNQLTNGDFVVAGGVGDVPVEDVNSDTDGNLLFDTSYVSAVNVFDTTTETWSSTAALANGRAFHSSTELGGGSVAVVGGRNDAGELSSIELINADGASMSVAAVDDLVQGRFYHSAVRALDDDGDVVIHDRRDVVVVGGCTESTDATGIDSYLCDPVTSNSIEILDAEDLTISVVANELATPRYLHSSVVLDDGRVMIAGGFDAEGNALNSIEYLTLNDGDLTQSTVATSSAVLPVARADFSALLLDDGRVLLAGGVTGTVEEPLGLDSLTIFDPETELFDVVDRIDRIIEQRSVDAVQLSDGRVVLSGGGHSVNSNTVVTGNSAVYLYTP